jgi:hypothetical protein
MAAGVVLVVHWAKPALTKTPASSNNSTNRAVALSRLPIRCLLEPNGVLSQSALVAKEVTKNGGRPSSDRFVENPGLKKNEMALGATFLPCLLAPLNPDVNLVTPLSHWAPVRLSEACSVTADRSIPPCPTFFGIRVNKEIISLGK